MRGDCTDERVDWNLVFSGSIVDYEFDTPVVRSNLARRRIGLLTNSASAFASAAISGGLLFVNGSFVLAVTTVLADGVVPVIQDPRVSQFILFTVPLAMVVAEWMMIDYLRAYFVAGTRGRRRRKATSTKIRGS